MIAGILSNRCPRCREGRVFVAPSPYDIKRMSAMHERCESCNLKYEMETGFFYGSMYAAYALTVAVSVAVFVALQVIHWPGITPYLLINAGVLLILSPVLFRLARMVWLYIFIKYNPEAVD